MNNSSMYNFHCGALKMFDDFTKQNQTADFVYLHDLPQYKVLLEKYHLAGIAGCGSELSRILNLLNWVGENVAHNGYNPGPENSNAFTQLDYAFRRGETCGITCSAQAVILTESLLALGIKARSLVILPFSPYDCDNHVVTMAYSTELQKWLFLDPSQNCYIVNRHGEIMSPPEIRDGLANLQELQCRFGQTPGRAGCVCENRNADYLGYLAKNMFYMFTYRINGFGFEQQPGAEGSLTGQQYYWLAPRGYDAHKNELANLRFRIDEFNKDDSTRKYADSAARRLAKLETAGDNNIYISAQEYFGKPQ